MNGFIPIQTCKICNKGQPTICEPCYKEKDLQARDYLTTIRQLKAYTQGAVEEIDLALLGRKFSRRSTGIEDADENEIYDGDILEYYNVQYTKETREVRFVNNHSFCGWNISQAFIQSGQAKIIGNIHENPELMEDNNVK